jgi:hypothetical protein
MCPSSYSRRHFVLAAGAFVTDPRLTRANIGDRTLSATEVEDFLLNGKVLKKKVLGVGITQSLRVTLSQEALVHDAHVQCIDESKTSFQTDRGTELNFRDCWKFNVAAYRLDRLLELNMTPPSIERRWAGKQGAFTWWLNDAMMEVERLRKKLSPPDYRRFNQQIYAIRVVDQLLLNMDRNLQNLLITPDWNVWMIDHTRCFRLRREIAAPKNLVQCDRALLARLRSLERPVVAERMGDLLRAGEIDALMSRRDLILRFFERKVADEGEDKVLYDMPPRTATYPIGAPSLLAGASKGA